MKYALDELDELRLSRFTYSFIERHLRVCFDKGASTLADIPFFFVNFVLRVNFLPVSFPYTLED